MSKEIKRKFGVKRISSMLLELTCKECGYRAGIHQTGGACPSIDINTGKRLPKRDPVMYLGREKRV